MFTIEQFFLAPAGDGSLELAGDEKASNGSDILLSHIVFKSLKRVLDMKVKAATKIIISLHLVMGCF